jgi:SAM-dependent methyltransferase
MIDIIKKLFPRELLEALVNSQFVFNLSKLRYKLLGRPLRQAETSKAHSRRYRENFFSAYCNGAGLDIGYGGDLLAPNCLGYDIEDGNAQLLDGIGTETYDFVYSSHTLEHMYNPMEALQNWWRVVKPGGYLILYIPHRDLYEKKMSLPSNWNVGHRHFFLMNENDPPDTLGIMPLIAETISGYELVYAKICSEGYTRTDPNVHSDGEYSIEVVLKKTI